MEKQRLLVIVGPTAVGKTEVSIQVAKQLDGEIVSADSMQIYRGMDIGTAKPSLAERNGVRHHLLDIVDPGEPFSVADYQRLARSIIGEINKRSKLPILTGGTGLYVRSVIDPYNFIPTSTNWDLRKKLRLEAEAEGGDLLYRRLKQVDPPTAGRIHSNDTRRIIRALEVFHNTKKPLSYWENKKTKMPAYDPLLLCLNRPRQELYERINLRVEQMLDAGLLEETERLLADGLSSNFIANQAIGYKEFVGYLQGMEPLDVAKERLKQTTRRYAKRQLTWFRADSRMHWIEMGQDRPTSKIVQTILQTVARKWQIG